MTQSSFEVILEKFDKRTQKTILEYLETIPIGDPLLVIDWNENRIQMLGPTAREMIITDIIAHGGKDPKNSGCCFHFELLGDLQTCREWLLGNRLGCFGTTPQMLLVLGGEHRDPVGESWLVIRISRKVVDMCDACFFYL